ncbi:polar amino acid transport system substrate-binding protein [Pseudoalteromonas espejiana DSM 9414]|uniref:Solute-binding protein family 3/N-terminal domain-containing protein n=1 Tax=Pseudoalteromonas espejiana TaxID=28107 RepID=A0A510XVJ0_9GAMM|nr:transporter substrate-binding domain-containing protein [Pseudoalteromonas espejiana]ASM51794.1 polar amino acid transport system substrate-binding protein [Pseudoalteromonas espejiana DSM 9414]GEK55018.1 hypothetical protein PES01_18630 [Pseudoalteromonas espejiana]
MFYGVIIFKGLFSLLFIFCVQPVLANNFKLTIYTDHFAPYNFLNDKGDLTGVNFDIVNTLCIDANVECTFKVQPFARAMKSVSLDPHSAIFSVAKHENRVSVFNWLGPLVSGETYFYKLATNNKVQGASLSELKSYTLGIVRGDIYGTLAEKAGFERDKNLLIVAHEQEYIELFIKSRLDLIMGSEQVVNNQLKAYGLSLNNVEQLYELPVPPSLRDNYLAFNKQVPLEITKRFEIAYNKLVQEHGLARFMSPYEN